MATLEERLAKLTPEQQQALTDRINSGQLSDRAQRGLDTFREQAPTPTPVETPTPVDTPTQTEARERLREIMPNATPTILEKDRVEPTPVETPTPTETVTPTQSQTEASNRLAQILPNATPTVLEKDKVTQPQVPQVLYSAQSFKGSDGKTYQTQRMSDNTLRTIDTSTGTAVTGFYTDNERDQIKQSLISGEEMNRDSIFNAINTGQNLSPEVISGVDYRYAQERANNLSKYSNLSASDLAYAISQGQLLPGTEVYQDLKNSNPQLISDAEKLNSLNSAFSTNKMTAETTLQTITSKILENYTGDIDSLQDRLSGNEQAIQLNEDMQLKAGELAELKDSLEFNYDDIEKRLEGRGATTGYARAISARESRDLMRAYNLKLNEYNTMAGTLQRLTENIKYEYEKEEQNRARDLQALEFAYGVASNELNFERGLEAEQRAEDRELAQLERQYQFTYGDINSENPTLQNIAIERAVGDMYTKYPIVGMESQAIKVQKVQDLIAQGLTGSQAVAQVEGEIRNSQRFKDLISPQTTGTQDWAKLDDGTLYNQRTGETKNIAGDLSQGTLGDMRNLAGQFPGEAWAKNNNPAGITWNSNFDNPTEGSTAQRLIDAGIRFEKGTSRPASEGGNYVTFPTMEEGLAAQRIMMQGTYGNSTVDQMLRSWVGTSEGPNYAKQVALNAGVDLKTKVSDLSEMELATLQSAKIQKESPGLYNILAQEAQPTIDTDGFDTASIPDFQNYFKTGKITASDQKRLIDEFGSIQEFKRQAEAYGNSNKTAQFSFAQEVKDLAENLKNTTRVGRQISPGLQFAPIIGGQAGDFEGDLATLKSKLSLNNLIELKSQGATFGALSNQELNFITDASLSLRRTRSNAEWNKELDRIITKMDEVIKKGGFDQQVDTQPQDTTQQTGAGSTLEAPSGNTYNY